MTFTVRAGATCPECGSDDVVWCDTTDCVCGGRRCPWLVCLDCGWRHTLAGGSIAPRDMPQRP